MTTAKTFPKLFKKTSKGADQGWEISTEKNVIVTRWGQVTGSQQETRDVVAEGKNAGKANATTAVQQAQAEALSRWEGKLKKGYVQDIEAARAGEVHDVIEGGVFPMLAHRFDQQGHKIVYPALSQPKFDGHRCIAMIDKAGKCTLWTRTRKPITSMGHVIKAVESLHLPANTVLDGELYHHDYKDKFDQLTSFIRDTEAKPGADVVQYHVYDVVNDKPQAERTKWLAVALSASKTQTVRPVPTLQVNDEEELMDSFQGFLGSGYEGVMVRNTAGLYKVNGRSYDLLKIKEFVDDEFLVTGVEAGRGKMADKGVFICQTKQKKEFRAKMVGKLEGLKIYLEQPELAVGKQLTVKYQGLTKDGLPRFPIGMRFRDSE